jgi:hypothetical protein
MNYCLGLSSAILGTGLILGHIQSAQAISEVEMGKTNLNYFVPAKRVPQLFLQSDFKSISKKFNITENTIFNSDGYLSQGKKKSQKC